jgi:hypothetical protein
LGGGEQYKERPVSKRTLPGMARRALPALLALITVVADLSGSHGAALGFVLAAIPAAFVLALDCYGDALEARCGGLRPLAAGVCVGLLVLSAALRSPAVVGGVPRVAVSAVVLALVLYAAAAAGALLPARRVPVEEREPEADRLAA